MNSHYITSININKLRHLENIKIYIDENEKKHLLLTGKNGVGKTTLLQEIKMFIKSIQYNKLLERVICWNKVKDEYNELKYKSVMEQYTSTINMDSCCIKDFGPGVEIDFSVIDDLEYLYKKGNFVLAYYSDNRSTSVVIPHSSERIILFEKYFIDEEPSDIFVKYLVDLKTQQAFARNEGELEVVENIEAWFNNFENALKDILDNDTIKLKFDYRNYDFKIIQEGREPYGFNELSSGYSSIINIISDLILRMDKNRAGVERDYGFDTEGIVLIDEIETHLHIDLQKKYYHF